jgi:hypothetical protein
MKALRRYVRVEPRAAWARTQLIVGTVAAIAVLVLASSASAFVPMVIDEDSIDNQINQYWFPADDPTQLGQTWSATEVNDDEAAVGWRQVLDFFATNGGLEIWINVGHNDDPAWHEVTPPPSWAAAGPTADGWQNFWMDPPGPGLGSGPNPEVLLDNIPADALGILDGSSGTPDDSELTGLIGQVVCAVVYDSDIGYDFTKSEANLQGSNLGRVAFRVLDTRARQDPGASTKSLLQVLIRIEPIEECSAPTAAEFQSLTATGHGKTVTVRWRTAAEFDALGYNVYRSTKGKRIKLNRQLIQTASIVGSSSGTHRYSLRVRLSSTNAVATSRYWVQVVKLDGSRTWYGPVRAVAAA